MKDYIVTTFLCLAFVGMLASCTAPELPEQSSSPSPAVSETSSTQTEVDGFVIEDGVLLSYEGSETDIVIPGEVTTITETSFGESAADVTSVTLGVNVDAVVPLAFSGMKKLSAIHVPEENTHYTYTNGALIDSAHSIVIVVPGTSEKFNEVFIDITSEIAETPENDFGHGVLFVFGNAAVTISIEENARYATGEDFRPFHCYIESVKFGDAFLAVNDTTPILSNRFIDFYQSDDMLIYFQGTAGFDDTYLLAEGEVYDISNSRSNDPDDYNVSVYTYGTDDEGNITYQWQPRKYVFDQEYVFDLQHCTGYDELFMEEGYVTLEEGALVYTPTATYTVGEEWDLEEKFENLLNYVEWADTQGDRDIDITDFGYPHNYPPCDTLDELLAYNKEHYESAQSPTGAVVEVSEDVFVDVDGTLIIPAIGSDEGRMADHSFYSIFDKLEDGELPCSELSKIIIGSAVIEVKKDCAASVTALGHTLEFAEHEMDLYGNFKFQAFEAGGCFVLANTAYGCGVTYVFTEQGITEINTPLNDGEDKPSSSVGHLYADGDTLCYIRYPYKFCCVQAVGGWLEECVSREEFFSEDGTVTVEDGKLILHPTETKRICDVFDMDELFAQWCNTIGLDPSKTTLDEYLAENALKYKEAH